MNAVRKKATGHHSRLSLINEAVNDQAEDFSVYESNFDDDKQLTNMSSSESPRVANVNPSGSAYRPRRYGKKHTSIETEKDKLVIKVKTIEPPRMAQVQSVKQLYIKERDGTISEQGDDISHISNYSKLYDK